MVVIKAFTSVFSLHSFSGDTSGERMTGWANLLTFRAGFANYLL
jgi:hypothetical protein